MLFSDPPTASLFPYHSSPAYWEAPGSWFLRLEMRLPWHAQEQCLRGLPSWDPGAALGGRFRCRQMKEVSVALLGLFPAPQCGILQEFWWSGGPRMSGAASGAWSACACWPRDRSITRKCSQAPLQASGMRLPGAQPPVLDQASRDSEWFSFILTGRVAFSRLFYFVYLEIILKVTPARYT